MNTQQVQLLHDVKSVLRYHHELGVDGYPLIDGGVEFYKKIRRLRETSEENIPRQKVACKPDLQEEAPAKVLTEVVGSIIDIEDEIKQCTACSLYKERIIPVPGKGGERGKVFFVGGWLAEEKGKELLSETVFGIEEDLMVSRMLKAIGLTDKDAFITNVIKCGIPDTTQPGKQNIQACSSYLHRQIEAQNPAIICTMGIIATRIFLDISRPLSQLRGRFHTHVTSTNKKVPLLATYHPTFLLQNPEMKRATWVDLQLIEKQLKKAGQL